MISRKEALLLLLIIVTAFFWRFFNFENRWALQQDQSRDAIIALYSIETQTLPLLGPPSSAGPFSFGPIYYWLITFFNLLIPGALSPWIGFTLLSVTTVLLFFFFGRSLYGTSFALVVSLVAAFASAEIFHAPDLLNPIPIVFFTTLAFYSLVKIIQEKKLMFSILLGLVVGIAINLHLQSLGLVFIPFFALFINQFNLKQKLIYALGAAGGLFFSFALLIYFDLIYKGVWIKSVIDYLFIGQNKFNSGVSLVREFTNFWPGLFGQVIFWLPQAGYVISALVILALVLTRNKKWVANKTWIILALSFLAQAVVLHTYKGPRLLIYLLVYHPYIIFFTGWVFWSFLKIHKLVGVILILAFLGLSSYSNFKIIQDNPHTKDILSLKRDLDKIYSGSLQIYSYKESLSASLPLFYLYKREGRILEGGKMIGICIHSILRSENLIDYDENCSAPNPLIARGNYRIYDLTGISQERIKSDQLYKIEPEKITSWLYQNYPK